MVANTTKINSLATAAANLAALYKGGLTSGTVNDLAPTTTTFVGDSGFSAVSNFYQAALLVFTSGDLAGEAERIASYDGGTKTFTMDHAFPSAPANADSFVILGKIR